MENTCIFPSKISESLDLKDVIDIKKHQHKVENTRLDGTLVFPTPQKYYNARPTFYIW